MQPPVLIPFKTASQFQNAKPLKIGGDQRSVTVFNVLLKS